jgi:oligopeptide transport system substrate-binding protein
MLRAAALLVLIPVATLLGWLAIGSPRPRADFVFASVEPRTIDPQRASWLWEIQLSAAMFEGLTRLNDRSFQPEPAVAERWDVSPDNRTYTFSLRHGARWSNGETVVAEDFRFAWLRALDPESAAQYASLLFVIDEARAYYRTRLDDDPSNDLPPESVGIVAVDPATLRVRLVGPCPYFLDLVSFITFAPNHRPTLQRWAYRGGQVRATQHLWTRSENLVCNGPFILERWDFKQGLRLRRNPAYWDADAIGVDTIEATMMENLNIALIAYETGSVDFIRGLPRPAAQKLLAEQRAGRRDDFHCGDRFATFFLRVNCRRPPLDRPDFRKALSLAINREAICEHVLRLEEAPAYTYVPQPVLDHMPRKTADGRTVLYQPPIGLGEDLSEAERLARARAHLRRSGFDGGRPIEIAFAPADPEQRLIAEAVQAMWEEGLQIRVELREVDATVLSTYIRNLDYDVVRSNWFGDYMDPTTFLEMFTTTSGQNRTGWSNAAYDRLIDAAARETDNVKRYRLLRDAEQILCAEEVPIIPVFFRRGNYLLNPRFTGLHDNVRDLPLLHRVRFSAESERP